ncbi:MAG: gluconokinase [Candidatus Sulfotelmatobacter sp.]
MIAIVMGVTGSGKTSVGRLLAEQLGWEFADADDFHPRANVEKIARGIPLNDEDRGPWLERLRIQIANWIANGKNGVLACSALKRSYRHELTVGPEVRFVYLKGSPELIAQRLRARRGHFADEKILASQFADLEEPETAVTVDISQTPGKIVAEIRERLGLAVASD